MDPNSLAIISNRFRESGILNIEPLVRIFTNQVDQCNVVHKLLNVLLKLENEDHYLLILFLNSQPDKNGLSRAHKLFNRPIRTNLPSAKPQPKPSPTNTAIETETQNRLSTLKPGDAVRIITEAKTQDKNGSVIAPNDRPSSYNVLNGKGNLITRNRHHLIPTNEKVIVRLNYDNITEPNETTSQKNVVPARTDIPSNITTPPVRTKSGRIKKPYISSQISPN